MEASSPMEEGADRQGEPARPVRRALSQGLERQPSGLHQLTREPAILPRRPAGGHPDRPACRSLAVFSFSEAGHLGMVLAAACGPCPARTIAIGSATMLSVRPPRETTVG